MWTALSSEKTQAECRKPSAQGRGECELAQSSSVAKADGRRHSGMCHTASLQSLIELWGHIINDPSEDILGSYLKYQPLLRTPVWSRGLGRKRWASRRCVNGEADMVLIESSPLLEHVAFSTVYPTGADFLKPLSYPMVLGHLTCPPPLTFYWHWSM
jgi:hypothetical protein